MNTTSTAQIFDGDSFRFSPSASVRERTLQYANETGRPAAEFVRWLLAVDDRIVLNKDGSLMACFAFSGMDLDSTSNVEINQVRSQLIYAIEQLQEESLVMAWQVRRRITTRYPDSEFPDPVSARIDAVQKRSFLANVQYINRHNVTLTMYPASNSARFLTRVQRIQEQGTGLWEGFKSVIAALTSSIMGESEFAYENNADIEQAVESFQKVIDMFLAATLPLGVRLMSGTELGGFLELASSPTSAIDVLADLPNSSSYMDTSMPVADINNSYSDVLEFKHNGRTTWGRCYAISLHKRETLSLDMLDKLMSAPFEYTMSHVFKFASRSAGIKMVDSVKTYHSNRRFPIKSILVGSLRGGDLTGVPVNESRQEDTDEAKALSDRIAVGQVGVGLYYGVVMVQAASHQDVVDAGASCEEILQTARLKPHLEGLHKFSAFAATVPGSHEEVAQWQKIKTVNFVDLCPLRTIASGDFYNVHWTEQLGTPCPALLVLPTKHRTPFYFTGYVGDVGHTLIIGPTGTGKTTIANLAWTAFRKYPSSRVIVFDKDYSCRPPILLQGGQYIDLNPEKQIGDNRPKMSPIHALLKDGNERHLEFVAKWVQKLVQMRDYKPTAQDLISLETALRSTIEIGKSDPTLLRLSSVVTQLDLQTEFAKALLPWTEGHIYGSYFDNTEDHFDLDSLSGIETGSILSHEELATPFMAYAFYRIESQLRDMGAETKPIPTLIYVPETWFFLRNPVFALEIEKWLVTIRKLGGTVWFDTQSPDKLVQSPIFPAFRDNISTRIFTPNRNAGTESLGGMYRNEFAMRDQQIQYIINGIPKSDYFISQGHLSRRITLNLNTEIMSCLRSDTKAQKLLERLHGTADWQNKYIDELSHEGVIK